MAKQLYEPGQMVETSIVAITDDTIFLDLGLKSEGILARSELADENGNLSVQVGDKIKVYFLKNNYEELHFTTKLSGKDTNTDVLENAWKNGIPVEGHVTQEIKGGFEVMIGSSRAFCPYSQMGYKKRDEPSAYVGRHLSFIITEYKNDGKDVLVSNRQIGEKEYADSLKKLAETIKEGAIVEGTVESIEKFGAFVDVNGFRVLLPISEMARERVTNAADIVQVGQKITAKVLKADWNTERVSISLKELIADPWDSVMKTHFVGQKIEGEISRVADFGVFVNLSKGIDGLVHISELEGISASTNIKKIYQPGQKMSVVIEKIDASARRISLKPASSAEQDKTAEKYLSSQDDDGETYNPFAALLKK